MPHHFHASNSPQQTLSRPNPLLTWISLRRTISLTRNPRHLLSLDITLSRPYFVPYSPFHRQMSTRLSLRYLTLSWPHSLNASPFTCLNLSPTHSFPTFPSPDMTSLTVTFLQNLTELISPNLTIPTSLCPWLIIYSNQILPDSSLPYFTLSGPNFHINTPFPPLNSP